MFELAEKKKIGENFERVRLKKKKEERKKEINETMKKNTILRSSTISLCLLKAEDHHNIHV